MAQRIYFDESGFTGNNLLHERQSYFAYASVATDPEEAGSVVSRIIKDYRVQGTELKGKNLTRFNKGRHAIDEIIKSYEGRVMISLSDKKYALAGKFFEYIFEPAISDISNLFYESNFHLFIANILYMEFNSRGAGAEEIFKEFEDLMRDMDEARLQNLFSSSVHRENSAVLTHIREFAQQRRADISQELKNLRDSPTGKWILDLTGSALGCLLAHWGLMYEELTAVCDESKPLLESPDFFNGMVGRKGETLFVDSPTGKQPITFNLTGPIVFANSKLEPGIQIADTIAAAAVFAITNTGDKLADKWREMLPEIASYGSILPDYAHLDLDKLSAKRNALILIELHSRAMKEQSLIEGMPEYVAWMTRALMHEKRGRLRTGFAY